MRISWKAASYSARLTSRAYRIRKSKGDSSEPGSKTGLKKLRIELNDLTFSLRNPLPLVPILSKSLKCNSPKKGVNKKAKSSRKLLYYGCFCTLSILNLILLSEGHTIHFMWVVLGNLELNANNIKQLTAVLIFITCLFRHCEENLHSDHMKGDRVLEGLYWNINQ